MEQKHLPKSLFLTIAIFSLFAFIAVNLHASMTAPAQSNLKKELLQTKVEDEAEQEDRNLAIPDVTVLGRLFELAQRLLPSH